jgi:pimeloyl-ACP methyl ester carboxylesterase
VRAGLYVRVAAIAATVFALNTGVAHGQLLEATTSTVTTPDGQPIEVTTGFVRVPEVRGPDGTSSGTVDLAVIRLRQSDATVRSSAHVILAGGPGDSGVNLVMGLARQGSSAAWRLFDGDVIGIDQRGTGRSRPNLETQVRYDLPLDTPGSAAEWLPHIDRASRKVAGEFRARGIRLEAYNTRESADDVADVRRALGYERLTLWGRSYGSHLALATAARHPRLVDRLVLVSPEGPNHTWKLPSQVDVVIRRLVERGATDLEAHIRQVLARLTAEPAKVLVRSPQTGTQTTIVLGAFDVQWITAHALGDPRLLATVPLAFREMAQGNFERMAQIALVRRSRAGVESAMKHMMDLSSGASVERQRQIESEARHALLGNAINFPGMFAADAWAPVTDLGEEFRRPVQSGIPTLILVGDLDPRTPVANARELAATLSAAKVVVLENATHQFDVFGSPAILTLLAQFLRGETLATNTVTLPAIVFQ